MGKREEAISEQYASDEYNAMEAHLRRSHPDQPNVQAIQHAYVSLLDPRHQTVLPRKGTIIWEKSLQLEKTDVAVRMAREALAALDKEAE